MIGGHSKFDCAIRNVFAPQFITFIYDATRIQEQDDQSILHASSFE
jgi:hypothetical protein